ncbi:hypothetical protein L1887_28402 [Cichorium endivia]|nr:hypothetical protein L1887_28402 [Cichorium endivia]
MSASSSSSQDSILPLNTVLHLITHRLTSSNYLLWNNQLLPLLAYQNLLDNVDGSADAPPSEIVSDGKPAPNPAYSAWLSADQRAVILLQASLSEEASSEIAGLPSCVFSQKVHWFLCGLGPTFETFSTAIRASRTPHNLRDLIAQVEGHELFLQYIHGSGTPPVAFTAQTRPSNPSRGHGGRSFRGGRGRRPPRCQLCRDKGHYASACPRLATYANHAPGSDADLAKAFHPQCHVSTTGPDWFVESGATDHMTPCTEPVSQPTPYSGNAKVAFGNGSNNETGSCSRRPM